jgi:hypothetical protein
VYAHVNGLGSMNNVAQMKLGKAPRDNARGYIIHNSTLLCMHTMRRLLPRGGLSATTHRFFKQPSI